MQAIIRRPRPRGKKVMEMKVLLINGSPHVNGTTHAALGVLAEELNKEGVQTEIFHIGTEPIRGCMACPVCAKKETNRCRYGDSVNQALDRMETADGVIFGTSVHYAAATGGLTSFMDRFFYGQSGLAYKPAAALAVARRGGNIGAFDQVSRYFPISGMPVVPSQYWNILFGAKPEEVLQDLEGLQILRTLARNMAWMLRCIEAGKQAGITPPVPEPKIRTNFIR